MTVRICVSFAAPVPMPARLTLWSPASSARVKLFNAPSVGTSFTAFTVTVKVRLTVLLSAWPSLTVTVIVATPLALAAGVKLKLPVAFGLV